jgi:ubiquitin-protein ligase
MSKRKPFWPGQTLVYGSSHMMMMLLRSLGRPQPLDSVVAEASEVIRLRTAQFSNTVREAKRTTC